MRKKVRDGLRLSLVECFTEAGTAFDRPEERMKRGANRPRGSEAMKEGISIRWLLPRKKDEPGDFASLVRDVAIVRIRSPKKWPNQAPEPTAMSVTIRATARIAPAIAVAHL